MIEPASGARHSGAWYVSWLFVAIALLCIPFGDFGIGTLEPWGELQRLFGGLFFPSLSTIEAPVDALMHTVAFAILGVALGSAAGFVLALVFHWAIVRVACALLRAVHELFWALIFLQIFGLHPLTGLLAIGIPYAATFAKIYAEILDEGDTRAADVISPRSGYLSTFFYARLPDLWVHFKTYTSYRLECALRSSTVLGFVGLPTLGYSLSSAFLEGQYSQVWGLLIIFYLLIASMRYWVRPALLPIYLIAAPFVINNDQTISLENVSRFFTEDIIPAPIRNGESWPGLVHWLSELWLTQAWPGIINTVLLTQIALVLSGIAALVMFPWISRWFFRRMGRKVGYFLLVIARSTPEYILAFIFLLLWGPSMLPAVVALALHNGAIIGHLIGRYSDDLQLRADISAGLNRYAFEVLPRVYGQFLAFLFYRWEIILRETAILGILGIATLGFYIDSAIQELRMDRAMMLIIITALLNVCVDWLSRWIRRRLSLRTTADCGSA